MNEETSKTLGNLFNGGIRIYAALAFIVFAPYFNWQYAQRHGFMEWLLFGEVIATAEAAAWPYFLLYPDYQDSAVAIDHIGKAIEYRNMAMHTLSEKGPGSIQSTGRRRVRFGLNLIKPGHLSP